MSGKKNKKINTIRRDSKSNNTVQKKPKEPEKIDSRKKPSRSLVDIRKFFEIIDNPEKICLENLSKTCGRAGF